ncbi:MAG: hypothetical protein KUG78_07795 [Kangiellaceae bacterium]|nr:hypothetical protein [Kangiellaceae bacterium]
MTTTQIFKFTKSLAVAFLFVTTLKSTVLFAEQKINLESYDWNGAIPESNVVHVINHYGDIRSRSNSENKVHLHASYQEIGDSPVKPEFVISVIQGNLTIEVKYNQLIFDSKNRLRGRTDLSVLFPPRVKIIAETKDGMIKIDKSASQVDARSDSGSIKLTTTGMFQVNSDSGNISLRLRGMHTAGKSYAKSISGTIVADIFDDMDLRLTAKSAAAVLFNGNNMNDRAVYRSQGKATSIVDFYSQTGEVRVNIVKPPTLVKSVKPTVNNIDLRDAQQSPLWKPGDPVKEINPKKDNRSKKGR